MNSKEEQKRLLELTEKRLSELIPNIEPKAIYEPFRYIMEEGGKRIRPILTMLACGAICGTPDKAVDAACAIEILHNFTLVHDDIMDNSPIRRGKETIHQKWDEPTAIIAGDTMVGYAYRILNAYNTGARYPQIVEAMNKALIEVCEGQSYDMQFNTNKNVKIDEYIMMIGKKTSILLQACASLGGNIAEANPEQLKSLDDYAYNLGIAFQIQDDLLDITADQAKFGKQIGQDLLEGKKAFLILKARELAKDAEDKALIEKFFDNDGLAKEEVPAMKRIYEKLNIFTIAQDEIERYLSQAKSALANLNQNQYTDNMLGLLDSLNKRVY